MAPTSLAAGAPAANYLGGHFGRGRTGHRSSVMLADLVVKLIVILLAELALLAAASTSTLAPDAGRLAGGPAKAPSLGETSQLVELIRTENESRRQFPAGEDQEARLFKVREAPPSFKPASRRQPLPPARDDESQAGQQSRALMRTRDEQQPTGKATSTSRLVRSAPRSPTGNRQPPAIGQGLPTVQALAGQRLIIPCRISARSVADQPRRPGLGPAGASRARPPNNPAQSSGVALIVWHKDDQLNSPIFALDARGTSIKEAKQQPIADVLKGRARADLVDFSQFNLAPAGASSGPALVIEDARLDDAGLYTCTVEFDRAPTQTYQAQVNISDPPKSMIIREEINGLQRPVQAQLAGPYDEDSSLALVCEAEPGQPEPGQVSWWQLDSETQLGPVELQSASAMRATSGSRIAQQGQPPATLVPAELASHLTTLSLGQPAELSSTFRPGSEPSEPPQSPQQPSAARDLYLGPRSFQKQAQQQLSNQQLIVQLIATNPAASGLLQALTGSETSLPSWARLRHWRRVDANRTDASVSAGDGSSPAARDKLISARLEIARLTRANWNTEFLCLATNSKFGAPLNASLALDMNLKPTEVRLVNKSNATFELGQKTVVECHVIGSRPSAAIRWLRGPLEIERRSSGEMSSEGVSEFSRDVNNLTKISYLTLAPQIGDNQRPLTCSAHNPKLGGVGQQQDGPLLSDSIVMNVQFQPRLALRLGAGIKADSVRLQGDVFMDCEIEANPPIQELVWLHEGRPLAANISAGIIMSNQSLVLRNLSVHQRGAYECQARNALGGPATSNRLLLRPRFEPVCDESLTKRRYEIPLNQPTRIECHVLAEPEEDLQFSWRINRNVSSAGADEGESSEPDADRSADTSAATITQYETNFTKLTVIFTPRSRRHYGHLLCSARNSMGLQERPCVIQLLQSELPEPVRGCFVDNQTHSSFSIHCGPASQAASSAVSDSPAHKSAGPGSSGTHYVLELYANPAAEHFGGRTSERDSSGHSMLRQSGKQDLQQGDYEEAEAAGEQAGDDEQQQQQTRVRRLVSELPSFNVLDLRPNSTYNLLIYVQNSKGRSAAAHHQVSTKALDGLEAAASTSANSGARLELLNNKRPAQGHAGSNQLLSFFKFDDYFAPAAASTRRPLIGVALVLLLSVISIIMIVFFVNRLVCSGKALARSARRQKVAAARRKGSAGSSSSPTNDDEEDEEELDNFMRRKHSANSRQLATISARASPAGGAKKKSAQAGDQNGPGSGSDTSRETNTDSTLVSSPTPKMLSRQTTGSNPSCSRELAAANSRPMNAPSQFEGANLAQMPRQKRCSHSDLSQLTASGMLSDARQQQLSSYKSTTLRPRASLVMSVRSGPDKEQLVQFMRQNPYGTISAQDGSTTRAQCQAQLTDVQSRGTPQVSLHSSECSSNNVDNSVDLMPHHLSAGAGQQLHWLANHSNYHLLASKGVDQERVDLGGMADGGVYVISDAESSQTPSGGPLRLIDASESDFWCQSGEPKHVMVAAGDRSRCHLVDGGQHASPLGAQSAGAHLLPLPNSFSIPVSLADHYEVASGRASSAGVWSEQPQQYRRLSSAENLLLMRRNPDQHQQRPSLAGDECLLGAFQFRQEPCWAPTSASPCPSRMHALSCEASSVCFAPEAQMSPAVHLTPPINFANDHLARFPRSAPECPPSGGQFADEPNQSLKRQQPSARHRVKFDTSNAASANADDNFGVNLTRDESA